MTAKTSAGRITALLCENSAWKAAAGLASDPALRGVDCVKVPCSGRVDEGLLLSLLEKGSVGVLVVGCPKDNCTFLRGNGQAEKRVNAARSAVTDAGLPPGVLRMAFVSSLDSHRLRDELLDFKRCLDDHSDT
ncbi:MAG TPA: hydrogenase iron-sulfur subunit [Spirochaetia bacterium]|nr:hydrogenase iron-sulfur subunit [Spirochaetia bacterium]